MPKRGTCKYGPEVADQVRAYKQDGLSWNMIAGSMGLTFYQICTIADHYKIRDPQKNFQANIGHVKQPKPQPIPAGVPTLPPLPSLLLPFPIIKRD